ncbi:hypothetical protein BDQ17DRAFT_979727 [Cyathus striatus]|nr:hypothetical protein BDQ17DRAFT_979727 [Cyathus striatus]
MASPNPMPKKFLQIIHRGKPADDVPYTEFHNDGEPSPNLGELGDVYIDTTSAKISMYGKLKTGWVKWAGPETQYLPYMPHPTIQGLILWCNPDIGTIGWRARAKVSSLSEYPSTSIMLASALNKRTEKKRKQPPEPSRFTGNPPGKRSNTSVTTNSINNHPSWDNHSGHGLQVGYASLPQQMIHLSHPLAQVMPALLLHQTPPQMPFLSMEEAYLKTFYLLLQYLHN